MKITLVAVGKAKPSAELSLYREFTERLPYGITVVEVEEKRPLPPERLKLQEAELILAAVPKGSYLIVLDERGKTFTSEAFAADLQNLQDQGINHFTFAIGGAFGHGENLKAKADKLLRLSDMTWPHMMVRAMLAEQLYRAHTINTGHPYHK